MIDVPGSRSTLGEKIGPARCLCYRGDDALWTVTHDGAVCSHCGEQRRLGCPPTDVVLLPCPGCDASETTWFTAANGDRICSCCGEQR